MFLVLYRTIFRLILLLNLSYQGLLLTLITINLITF